MSSRRMWAHLWPWRVEEEIPIGHITNGVHVPSWLAWQMQQLYDRIFVADWMRHMGKPEIWQEIYRCDPGELWETHYALKNLLLQFVRRRVSRQCRRRGESDEAVEQARNLLDPNILTIGFARRFATYKRADLIMSDLDRLAALVNDPQTADSIDLCRQGPSGRRAGQAADSQNRQPAARSALRRPHGVRRGLRHQRRPALGARRRRVAEQSAPSAGSLRHQRRKGGAQRRLESFDSRRLVGGSLRRQERLCHRPRHIARFRRNRRSPRRRGSATACWSKKSFRCSTIATATACRSTGFKRMMNSISSLAWRFSSHRMVADYVTHCYLPAAGGLSSRHERAVAK